MAKEDIYDNKKRTSTYKKDGSLEEALTDLNNLIDPLALEQLGEPQKPIVLIMGCARSGSTVMLQYLASLGLFSYPSNLIARFYKNPYLGIRVQQALVEFDYQNQIGFNTDTGPAFTSDLGKTKGALAPSEFWYFWRVFFQFSNYNKLSEENKAAVDTPIFLKKLAAFETLTGMSPVMKGMILNWDIPFLHQLSSKFIFINLKRNIIDNAQSLLASRKKFFNDVEKWYSFRPLEYDELIEKSPIEQVVGQVYYTQKAIEKGLELVPDANQITIDYEAFCKAPYALLLKLQQKFEALGTSLELPENDQRTFTASKKKIADATALLAFKKALEQYD